MRAISLWQPWASACVLGLKEYETRHWPTSYRGHLVIHAAKKNPKNDWRYNRDGLAGLAGKRMIKALVEAGVADYTDLPLGALLGFVDLVGCYKTNEVVHGISDQEFSFGDWSPGRYCWQFANPRIYETPIPWIGHQGFFDVAGYVAQLKPVR